MAANDADERVRIRESILRYLRDHPDAGDTARGIVLHWLPAPQFERAADLIDAVLGRMVERGELRASTLPDGKLFFDREPRP